MELSITLTLHMRRSSYEHDQPCPRGKGSIAVSDRAIFVSRGGMVQMIVP